MKQIGELMSSYSLERLFRESIRFTIVGAFNTSICFILYKLFVYLDPWPAYTLGFAFFLSEGLSCIVAHYLHRRITFRSSSPYGRSLTLTLIIYTSNTTSLCEQPYTSLVWHLAPLCTLVECGEELVES